MAVGAAWTVSMRLAISGLGIISTMILVRLLSPEDFGLVALATMLLGFLAVMSDFSFEIYLIQHQDASPEHYDTVWTLSIIRGAALSLILVAFAKPVAVFFDQPPLQGILYWLALTLLIGGFRNGLQVGVWG